MMSAVARGKAHGLFDQKRSDVFHGVKRPQEDLVTSAVFGSATLLPMPARCAAFDILLGQECREAAAFAPDQDVKVEFWPGFKGSGERHRVEPDVLLTCDGRTVIIEIKWRSPLPYNQIADEICAVCGAGRLVPG